jgi:hypothetical protein
MGTSSDLSLGRTFILILIGQMKTNKEKTTRFPGLLAKNEPSERSIMNSQNNLPGQGGVRLNQGRVSIPFDMGNRPHQPSLETRLR